MITKIQSKDKLSNVEVADKKWCVNFNQRLITVKRTERDAEGKESEREEQVYEIYQAQHTGVRPTIRMQKEDVKEAVNQFESTDINKFTLGDGTTAWLNKATRNGLRSSLAVEKANGSKTTTLWLNGKGYDVKIDTLLAFLDDLEMFAISVFNVTLKHLTEIENGNNYLEYDFTVGYPEKITLKID